MIGSPQLISSISQGMFKSWDRYLLYLIELTVYQQFLFVVFQTIFQMNSRGVATNDQNINCIFDASNENQYQAQVPIYDEDNWKQQELYYQNKDIESEKNLAIYDSQVDADQKLIKKIDECSKQSFFKIKSTKQIHQSQKRGLMNKKASRKNIQSLAEKSSNSILKQGYMEKRTDGFIFKWKTRYFVLTTQKLYFFPDHNKQKVTGCINIKIMPVVLRSSIQQHQIILDFQGECQNIKLRCETKQQTSSWIKILQQVIKFHTRQNKLLLKTIVKPFYIQQDIITEKQFLNSSETGDVLLFYTNHTGAKIQRILTNSSFDHVGIVIKFGKNQLMVFQSNQTYGVSIYDWAQYIRVFNLYQKVTVRKLCSVRKKQYHHLFLNFVKKNLGKKFDINAMKLLKLQSDFDWNMAKQDETRGFFCSELVAKAYKSVGLLDPVKYSGRYWPVDFSEKNQMNLKNGAFLGPQQSIMLNKHLKNKP